MVMLVVRLGEIDVAYQVRRSSRAKNVRLKVNATEGLVVVIPETYDDKTLPALLVGRRVWIERQLAYFQTAPVWKADVEPNDGQAIQFRGDRYVLCIDEVEAGRRSVVSLEGRLVKMRLQPRDEGLTVLTRWLRQQARSHIKAELETLGKGRNSGRLFIMDQRTRWGSCSGKGNLSFNWRLVMAPPEVLRYVVAHELAHISERKHSPRFWLVVRGMVGDVDRPRRWLRDFGGTLRV